MLRWTTSGWKFRATVPFRLATNTGWWRCHASNITFENRELEQQIINWAYSALLFQTVILTNSNFPILIIETYDQLKMVINFMYKINHLFRKTACVDINNLLMFHLLASNGSRSSSTVDDRKAAGAAISSCQRWVDFSTGTGMPKMLH